jgi:tripartite-type tricarboxylate transporter receptor subunit TctC
LGQAHQSQAVTIVVPFLAGGAVDVMCRIIAAKLQDYWKQPAVVENRPGAGGNVGSNSVAVAPPEATGCCSRRTARCPIM